MSDRHKERYVSENKLNPENRRNDKKEKNKI